MPSGFASRKSSSRSDREDPSDIFTLYEQNIGMLTPLIADELREAEKHYPESWIQRRHQRSGGSKQTQLEIYRPDSGTLVTEGKDDGTHRGNLKKNTDPDKYIRGKYGHMVQR